MNTPADYRAIDRHDAPTEYVPREVLDAEQEQDERELAMLDAGQWDAEHEWKLGQLAIAQATDEQGS